MRTNNRTVLLFCSLLVLLSVNSFAFGACIGRQKNSSLPQEQISGTIISQGEGIIQPAFRIDEITGNAFRIPSSFYKVSDLAFPSKAKFSRLLFKDIDQVFTRTSSVPRHIVFRALLV